MDDFDAKDFHVRGPMVVFSYPYDGSDVEPDWRWTLGHNLEVAGGLAHSQDLGMQAGVDLGVMLTMTKVKERAAQDAIEAAKEKSPIITGTGVQLWLPGFESSKRSK